MSRPPPPPVFSFRSDMAAVNNVDYLFSSLLCAGTTDGKVHLWDLDTKREKHKFQAGEESCLSVFNLHDRLLTQEKGGKIHLWSTQGCSFSQETTIKSPYVGFCRVEVNSSLSWQNSLVFGPGEDSTVNIISLKSGVMVSSLKTISEKLGEVMSLKYFEVGGSSYLLTAYESGHLYLWDLNTRKYLCEMKLDNTPMDIDFDPQKNMGVCGTESNTFYVFKLDKNVLSLYKSIEITNPGISRTCIRPDGRLLALGCWDGRIRLYSWKSLKPLAVLSEHQETVHDVCFSRDKIPSVNCQYLMAVAGKDKRISLWNVYNDV